MSRQKHETVSGRYWAEARNASERPQSLYRAQGAPAQPPAPSVGTCGEALLYRWRVKAGWVLPPGHAGNVPRNGSFVDMVFSA